MTGTARDRGVAIRVEGLRVSYGSVMVVDDINFEARLGAITVLLGPNGAGKTTTLNCIEGFQRPERGEVRVMDRDPITRSADVHRCLGVMLQKGGLHTAIRPAEALRTFASFYDRAREPSELLELVGLVDQARTPWRALSGGEQQRLSLALALVGRPQVVVLDEPTAGVDPSGKQLLRHVIRNLRREGLGVLITTHDLAEVEELADHIVIIDHGRVVAVGPPEDLMASVESDDLRFRARAGLPIGELGEQLGANVTEPEPGRYVVAVAPDPAVVAHLTSWLAAHDELLGELTAGRRRLEEVFLRLTSEVDAETGAAGAAAPRPIRSRRPGTAARRSRRQGPTP